MLIKQYSPNMLKTYELCPKKFYFKYIKNISMPIDDDIFFFGKNIHSIARYYLNKENIDKMEESLSEKEFAVWQKLKASEYFKHDVIGTELPLSVKIEDNFICGRLDALVKNNDKYYILDYKTGSIPQNAQYDFQTMIYMLAVNDYYKTNNIVFVYIDLKNNSNTEIELHSDLIKKYKELVSNTIKKINQSETYNKKNNCSCEYSKICY